MAGGVQGVGVTFSGRDGTLAGPPTLRDPALAAVTDRDGIRSLAYRSTEPDVVVPTTTGESTTTLDGHHLGGRDDDHRGRDDHHRRHHDDHHAHRRPSRRPRRST